MSDPTRNDGWMHSQSLRETNYGRIAGIRLKPRSLPFILRDQSLIRPFIRFILPSILVPRRNIAQSEVVNERYIAVEVSSDMSELVEQREPKIVETVVTQRE